MGPQLQNQESMLKESIKHFLTLYHRGSSDFSSFESIFFRLIQTMLDPPIEITWFYSAVTFHAAKSSAQNNPFTRVVRAKDLLNLLISCSNLSTASKKIALLAPTVYELYNIVCDTRKSDLCEKMEVYKLVEDMVSYVTMSAGVYNYGNEDVECDNIVVCFEDLIQVWTSDRGGGNCNFAKSLRTFFPLLTDGTWKGMNARCGIHELVGIVQCEVFFLKLYLSFSSGICTTDYLKDTRDQMVEIIKGFRSCYFLGDAILIVSSDEDEIFDSTCIVDWNAVTTNEAMLLTNGQNPLKNYDGLLRNSIHYFLGKYPINIFRLSNLIALFHRLILDLKVPPLEIMWFYGAIMFHKCYPNFLSPQAKLVFAKEFLELLNSCLCSGSVMKKVAMIAPVFSLLYHLHFNFSVTDPSLRVKIEITVEKIVSHISICCAQYFYEPDQMTDSLEAYILDLVRIWTVDQIGISNKVDVLTSFFPTLDNEFHHEVTMSMGYLVGVVMHEALLLRLCMKITPGVDKEVLRRDMLNLAIQTIKGFRNFYFLDMLLKMLLEPSLPAAASLSSEDAVLLRKALYDAVILVDYSFYSGRWAHSNSISHPKKLSLVWVLAADHAIQFARATMDEDKADAYLNAYCESQMVTGLIKWVNSQIGMVHPNSRPEITTPRALINWLLALEDHGLQVFDHSMSLLRAKALACVENEPPQLSLQTKNLNQSKFDLNVINADEDQEMDGQLNNVPGDLCLNMKKDSGRKRKEGLTGVGESPNKQLKLGLLGFTVGKFSPLKSDDGSRFENPVINISSGDEMDVDKRL